MSPKRVQRGRGVDTAGYALIVRKLRVNILSFLLILKYERVETYIFIRYSKPVRYFLGGKDDFYLV